ncbi:hypothetical protein HZC30_06365 [Candidatus Woesearchaeota archaeon]|nr:hypothetical protein [Candidatus Woesearchaeota archaeon]
MPQKGESIFPPFQPLRVKYKDVFDLKAFYEAVHEWLVQNGWGTIEEGEVDHFETLYGERIGREGMKEIWIQWRVKKDAEGGSNFTYYLNLDYHVLGLTSIEAVKEGMKMKVNKGELDLYINAFIEEKYSKALEQNPILKYFFILFKQRVYRKEYEQRKKELYQETYVLQNFIKQWFKLKRYLPYEESKSFFPSSAWPSHLKEQ